MAESRQHIVAWVASHVLPHEAAVRAWLKRWTWQIEDIDDIVQEAYTRLSSLDSIAHIGSGRAYLFQTTRNIVLEQIRRAKIVRIENVTDVSLSNILDETPPLERVVGGVHDLLRVERLIEQLPVKCRRVFVLRRIYGVSQREIAAMFGISESAVEKLSARGLALILQALEGDELPDHLREGEIGEHSKDRTRSR